MPMRKLTRGRHGLRVRRLATVVGILGAVLASHASLVLAAEQRDQASRFKYVGGTENVQYLCVGTLQVGDDALTYKCGPSEVRIPYRDVETMQYRADVPRRIRKMKVRWTAIPPEHTAGNKNLYFNLIFRPSGVTHVLVLEVPENQMRPYLAEIDLKMGRRVDVESHENYSP